MAQLNRIVIMDEGPQEMFDRLMVIVGKIRGLGGDDLDDHHVVKVMLEGPRTELASGLLLDLDTLAGLLTLYTMHQIWSYAWVYVLIILPFLTKSRLRRRLCLKLILHNIKENGVAKTKGTKIIVRSNVTMFPSL